jgi:leader peptidase (prepilin peptidase)/N-methyltransferase
MTTEAAVMGAGLAVAVSPVLASWSAQLACDGDAAPWWRPRRPSLRRWLVVTAVAAGLAVAATSGRPQPAWWLLATGGAVLVVVDAERFRLPARFTYPFGGAVLATLVVAALVDRAPSPLLRALTAMAIVAGLWFVAALASPRSVGLGDVRLAGLTAAALGWLGWQQVLLGQALTAILAVLTAAVVAIAHPELRSRRMPVPMGPAMIGAAVIACWF